jgi:hypothetical protein
MGPPSEDFNDPGGYTKNMAERNGTLMLVGEILGQKVSEGRACLEPPGVSARIGSGC